MEDIIRLDRVPIFRDQLSFLIPCDWVEGESKEDYYLFHAPNTDSGWLRVSLLTRELAKETPADRLHRLHLKWRSKDEDHGFIEERTNNVIRVREKDTEQDGETLRLYYWCVANRVQPNLVQEAIFSFTVLGARIHNPQTLDMVKVVGELVTQAQFSRANLVN
jgi:hypothetical protein